MLCCVKCEGKISNSFVILRSFRQGNILVINKFSQDAIGCREHFPENRKGDNFFSECLKDQLHALKQKKRKKSQLTRSVIMGILGSEVNSNNDMTVI